MKILLVTATYKPSINGVSISVENLKNSLINMGHEVKVLAPDNKGSKSDLEVLRYPSIQNPLVADYPIPLFPGIKSIYKLITSFKPEIVHTHHPFHVGFFAKIIADSFHIPLVFTFHTRYDLYAEKYAEFLPKKLKVKFIDNSVEKFCLKVDCVITPSEFLNRYLKKKHKYLNVKTAPSGVASIKVSKSSKKELRKRLNLPASKKILLMLSRLGKEKNIDLLIKSMNFLNNNYLLLIAGSGPDESRLKKLVAFEGLSEKVEFAGRIEHEDVGLYYQASDIFLCSSQTETQGMVFLEAMSFGLPVVAVDSPASREWVSKKTGILTDNKSDNVADVILGLNSLKIKAISKEAKVFSKRFSQEAISEKIVKIYKETIKRKEGNTR